MISFLLCPSMKAMKRSSTTTRKGAVDNGVKREIEWELTPGGMLVQKRSSRVESDASGNMMIKIKVSHGAHHHEIILPAQSTFGGLKTVLASKTGLDCKEQRLLFRGKEREDDEFLHMVGVHDTSKVVLLEDPASTERKHREMRRNQACEAVAEVKAEVDMLKNKAAQLETKVQSGVHVSDKEFVVLTELLMSQLLKLDAIEADGEAKVQRKTEVRRVQSFVDTLDALKARNVIPLSTPARLLSATIITHDWEVFD